MSISDNWQSKLTGVSLLGLLATTSVSCANVSSIPEGDKRSCDFTDTLVEELGVTQEEADKLISQEPAARFNSEYLFYGTEEQVEKINDTEPNEGECNLKATTYRGLINSQNSTEESSSYTVAIEVFEKAQQRF